MYIQRKLHKAIKKHIPKKEYTIITGARQVGKTSLLLALYKELSETKKQVHYLTFEDYEVLESINKHPEEIFRYVPRPLKLIEPSKEKQNIVYLLIDEIQYAATPTSFLKYLFDTYGENLKIIATGSSAFYIDQKFEDSLAGRKRIFELKSLDFEEWLTFNKQHRILEELIEVRKQKEYISSSSHEFINHFHNYLLFGGFPRVVLEKNQTDKIYILRELMNSFLKKDLLESNITRTDKFYKFFSLLAGQIGNLINRNELANTLGVDNKTIERYLFVLQKSFHIELIRPFSSNLRKELTKMPKLFFKDTGLRNIALNNFSDVDNRTDTSALLENYLFLRLSQIYDADSIRFWRTADGKEIDFIVNDTFGGKYAYEVKLNCKTGKNKSTHKFASTYPDFSIQITSLNYDPKCLWIFKI